MIHEDEVRREKTEGQANGDPRSLVESLYCKRNDRRALCASRLFPMRSALWSSPGRAESRAPLLRLLSSWEGDTVRVGAGLGGE